MATWLGGRGAEGTTRRTEDKQYRVVRTDLGMVRVQGARGRHTRPSLGGPCKAYLGTQRCSSQTFRVPSMGRGEGEAASQSLISVCRREREEAAGARRREPAGHSGHLMPSGCYLRTAHPLLKRCGDRREPEAGGPEETLQECGEEGTVTQTGAVAEGRRYRGSDRPLTGEKKSRVRGRQAHGSVSRESREGREAGASMPLPSPSQSSLGLGAVH